MIKRRAIPLAILLLLLLFPLFNLGAFFSSKTEMTEHSRSLATPNDRDDATLILLSQKIYPDLYTWEKTIVSNHFTVYYNTTGPNAVNDQYAIDVSDSFEHSWTREVTDFGFREPPDSHMTVYIRDIAALGVTSIQGPPYHVVDITIDTGLSTDLIHETCAHEFFHTIQASYDITEPDWIIEGTATWMISKVYPSSTGSALYIDWVNNYMSHPDETITARSYDAILFWIFIDEKRGGSNTIENVLQNTVSQDSIYAVNATLLATQSTTFANTFKEWTIANYLKDSYYSQAASFTPVARSSFSYTGNWHQYIVSVADWGTDYYEATSSVIYMETQFSGVQYHNLTKILIEDSYAITSDTVLDGNYLGSFRLMQANLLDKVVVIVRSIATEASNGRQDYILTWLGFAQMQSGPYDLISSSTTISLQDTGTQSSSTTSIGAYNTVSSQMSSTTYAGVIGRTTSQASSSESITTLSSQNAQMSSQTAVGLVSRSSAQASSQETIVAGGDSSSAGPLISMQVTYIGDVNADGKVDQIDLIELNLAYGSTQGAPNWNPNCDINGDGIVDAVDLLYLGANYGKTAP